MTSKKPEAEQVAILAAFVEGEKKFAYHYKRWVDNSKTVRKSINPGQVMQGIQFYFFYSFF